MRGKTIARLSAIAVALVLTTAGWPAAAADKKQPAEDKVAVVNGAVITRTDFDRAVNFAKQRALQTGKPVDDAQLNKGVLEQLIGTALLYQESKKEGIKIDQKSR